MRFLENGPSIPDDLLTARDEGRVVFFCGAGVSSARAKLSGFLDLVEDVIRGLGVPADSDASKILAEARSIEGRTGVSGLISADSIFGFLEGDFAAGEIELEVAKALLPCPDVDLSAHRTLLDLATTPERIVRLVTTNFDRLFEDCDGALEVWQPPRLPDPFRPKDFDGIIHLHGRAAEDYMSAEGDGFVLSSSEFGRAYLSEGWATKFFKEVVDQFVVVFVGYAADDPPVRYLLEALNRKSDQLDDAYAFQSGTQEEATGKWRQKGIEAIAYTEDNGHQALWESLEAWAVRARAPDDWSNSVIDLARKGPEQLDPHKRGQVAHIVSTPKGARLFAEGDAPPPAEWLCVIDPHQRYAKPGPAGRFGRQRPVVDPFGLYGLDSDIVPKNIDPDDHQAKRDTPVDAWDGFAANRRDRQSLRDDSFSAFRGPWATNAARLPPRLRQMGEWLGKVSHQPASVWWAAHQIALHPYIQQEVRRVLERSHSGSPVIRRAWRYLFEVWAEKHDEFPPDPIELKAAIDNDGWDGAAIRKYAAIHRPHLKAERNYFGGPKAPEWREDLRLDDVLSLEVEYPDHWDDAKIPDDWLESAVRELRKNLEHALQLETELGGYGLSDISPIVPDEARSNDQYQREHGLSARVIRFSSLFERLVGNNVSAASQEFAAWPADDDTIFSRIRIWACGMARLTPAQALGPLVGSLSDNAFWDIRHQRDLLLVLSKRGQELSNESRAGIEGRILMGPPRRKDEEGAQFAKRRASVSLSRLIWLSENGCKLTVDLEAETERLRALAPEWKPEFAAKAAASMDGGSGWVKTETDHSSLIDEPLSSILSKASELSGRTDDFRVERDPFLGLSTKRPVRAFAALTGAARRQEYPEWAWRTFLNPKARETDGPRFSALIGERISRFPDEAVAEFAHPVSGWLTGTSKALASNYSQSFDKIVSKLIDVLRTRPFAGHSAILRGNEERDWTMEAINAPVGKIAEALFDDPRKDGLDVGGGFPADWLEFVNDLISLPGDLRRHALVVFAHNLSWFYTIDPDWDEANLLSVLDGDDQKDRNAVWSGFFWGARAGGQKLFIHMKSSLLALAKERTLTGHGEALSGIILAGWGGLIEKTGKRLVANDEMREVLLHADDDFRSHILWLVETWADSEEEDVRKTLSQLLPEFNRDAWPRQRSAKSPEISARLFDLAFSNAERFPEMAEAILPLLTKIERNHVMLPNPTRDNIVDLYPDQTLALLDAVLPDNVAAWPFGIDAVLQRIVQADGGLRLDERWLELNRKWNSA